MQSDPTNTGTGKDGFTLPEFPPETAKAAVPEGPKHKFIIPISRADLEMLRTKAAAKGWIINGDFGECNYKGIKFAFSYKDAVAGAAAGSFEVTILEKTGLASIASDAHIENETKKEVAELLKEPAATATKEG